MDKSAITLFATRNFGTGLFLLKKHSPTILTTVGVVGVVAAGVFASRATLKLEPIVEQAKTNLETVHELAEGDHYKTKQERINDLARVYTHAAIDLTKLYGPSLLLAAGSISCIVGAQGIMHKRNAGLLVSLKAAESVYSKYRQRVIDELGVDQERDIFANVTEREETDEKGKKTIVAELGDGLNAPYAKIFDDTHSNWRNDPHLNLYYLQAVNQQMNDLLHARGHVFLNEVYEALEFEHTTAGAVTGWIHNPEQGDDYIDFGIYNFADDKKRQFLLGNNTGIVLDFNVDGVIYDRIGNSKL